MNLTTLPFYLEGQNLPESIPGHHFPEKLGDPGSHGESATWVFSRVMRFRTSFIILAYFLL
jgi:hypothetical protein